MTHVSNISRRQVTKGAAWSVPVVALGASAPVLAASVDCPAGEQTASTSYTYDAFLEFFGEQPLGQWTITVTTTYPGTVSEGETIAPTLSVQVVTSEAAADQLRGIGVATFSTDTSQTGEWNLTNYDVTGAAAAPGAKSLPLLIPETTVPASGPVTINLTLTPEAEATAGTGDFTVSLANMATWLDARTEDGSPASVSPAIRLRPAEGTDTTLFTTCVVAA